MGKHNKCKSPKVVVVDCNDDHKKDVEKKEAKEFKKFAKRCCVHENVDTAVRTYEFLTSGDPKKFCKALESVDENFTLRFIANNPNYFSSLEPQPVPPQTAPGFIPYAGIFHGKEGLRNFLILQALYTQAFEPLYGSTVTPYNVFFNCGFSRVGFFVNTFNSSVSYVLPEGAEDPTRVVEQGSCGSVTVVIFTFGCDGKIIAAELYNTALDTAAAFYVANPTLLILTPPDIAKLFPDEERCKCY